MGMMGDTSVTFMTSAGGGARDSARKDVVTAAFHYQLARVVPEGHHRNEVKSNAFAAKVSGVYF